MDKLCSIAVLFLCVNIAVTIESMQCQQNGESLQCSKDSGEQLCTCCRPDGSSIIEPSKELKSCNCIVDREAKRKQSSVMLGVFVPSCKEDGYYSPKQCRSSAGMCWCVDQDGNKITEPTRGVVSCE